MLHGCTQGLDDFAAGTAMNEAALAQGFFVLYPAQSQQANPQHCWKWFKHNHQRRGRGEPALLAGMTRDVMARHAIDPERVHVAGLSAGGAMAAILGDAYPDLHAAVGAHSGLAAGVASDLPSALAAMKGGGTNVLSVPSGVPTVVFHGDADATVHPCNGEQVIAARRWHRDDGRTAEAAGQLWSRLHATRAPRRRWSGGRRTLAAAWRAPRLVGRQREGLVHRRPRARRQRRNAALLLLRAPSPADALTAAGRSPRRRLRDRRAAWRAGRRLARHGSSSDSRRLASHEPLLHFRGLAKLNSWPSGSVMWK
ncbi:MULTISPECIES: extracellular catalytic domain type 1 short-chain-length polyhydroxyalkanoate depolymerase [unclassified Variovorax]|uniref:extracellular catalytic domain type 1 short-chain-length polyhydroxyalkanoate depolymerase n=1 Tax=unclassified Variovorax TaxID=663243 RepID=UPI003ED0FBBB